MKLIDRAIQDLGTKEIPGLANNQKILQFLQYVDKSVKDETTSWCSAAVNYWAHDCGLPISGSLAARSWLKVGKNTTTPTRGNDIVVLWRVKPNSWQGHVGVYFHHNKTHVWILGGNQSDQVSVEAFPITQLLAFRTLG